MNLQAVAIDCGWLCELDTLGYQDLQEAMQFLRELDLAEVPLLLDSQSHIIGEYDRNLRSCLAGKGFVANRFQHGPVEHFSGQPARGCADCLVELKFDPNDVPYVGVAQRGHGVYLTHESKHAEPARVAAIEAQCGVVVGDLARVRELLA